MSSYCAISGCGKPIENREQKLCATHNKQRRAKALPVKVNPKIKPVSDQQSERLKIYAQLKKIWIKGKQCKVCGGDATEVHHMKGRENDLLLDTSWWLPVDFDCHRKITDQPAWAEANGYSVSRLKIETA